MYVWRGENKTCMGFFCITSLRGLYLEGLIHGGAYFPNFAVFCQKNLKILNLSKNSSPKLFSAGRSRSIIDI